MLAVRVPDGGVYWSERLAAQNFVEYEPFGQSWPLLGRMVPPFSRSHEVVERCLTAHYSAVVNQI